MELDAGSDQAIAGVVTQGRNNGANDWQGPNANQWVTQYLVKASSDGTSWSEVDCARTFSGNINPSTPVNGRFTRAIMARYIRIYIDGWNGHPSVRAGLLLCDNNYHQTKESSWSIRVYKGTHGSVMWDQPDDSTLTYVGKGHPKYIDFNNVADIREFVKGVSEKNFVAIVEGTLVIGKEGEYKICAQSSDGSKISVDGQDLVDNDGKHQVIEKCQKTNLKAGPHKVKIDYFQNSGDIDLEATYSGPDTDNAKVSMPADDFIMNIYSSPNDILKKPDLSSLVPIGASVGIPEINFHSFKAFKKYVPDVPDEYFATNSLLWLTMVATTVLSASVGKSKCLRKSIRLVVTTSMVVATCAFKSHTVAATQTAHT